MSDRDRLREDAGGADDDNMACRPSIIDDFVELAAKPDLARETAALASGVSELLVALHAADSEMLSRPDVVNCLARLHGGLQSIHSRVDRLEEQVRILHDQVALDSTTATAKFKAMQEKHDALDRKCAASQHMLDGMKVEEQERNSAAAVFLRQAAIDVQNYCIEQAMH